MNTYYFVFSGMFFIIFIANLKTGESRLISSFIEVSRDKNPAAFYTFSAVWLILGIVFLYLGFTK